MIFLNIIKANAAYARLQTDYATTTSEVTKLTEQIKADAEKIVEYEKTIAAFSLDETKATLEKQIVDLTTAHAEVVKEYIIKLDASENASANKAQTILASIGVPEETIPAEPVEATLTAVEAFNKFEAMPAGTARTAFFNQNQTAIIAGMNGKQ